jgi:hypothetical protein
MTATLSQAATALGTAIGTISGLRVVAHPTDAINPPVAVIEPNSVEYHRAFANGLTQMTFTVTVIVSRVTDRLALANLDPYIATDGASSIRAAIETDQTLGGVVQAVKMTTASQFVTVALADASYFAVQTEVIVYA